MPDFLCCSWLYLLLCDRCCSIFDADLAQLQKVQEQPVVLGFELRAAHLAEHVRPPLPQLSYALLHASLKPLGMRRDDVLDCCIFAAVFGLLFDSFHLLLLKMINF